MGGRGGGGGTPRGPAGGTAVADVAVAQTAVDPQSLPLDRPDIARDILAVVDQINVDAGRGRSDPVSIALLRSRLSQYGRTDLDTAMRQLSRRGEAQTSTAPNQASTQQSGVLLQGQWRTLIRRS